MVDGGEAGNGQGRGDGEAREGRSAGGAVAEVIRAAGGRYPDGLAPVHNPMHGPPEPDAIARQLAAFVVAELRADLASGVFHIASVGSVTGVVLADGRQVVVKARPPAYVPRFLDAVVAAQH